MTKNNNIHQEDHHSERGQSLVEMAMSLVILLLLVGGIVDLGRAFFTFMALRDSVQEGALYGSINPTLTQEIKNHVLDSSDMVPDLIDSDDITVAVVGTACTGNGIRVTATYPDFPITMPFMGAALGRQTISISATVTDTILSPACH
ncbi:MAG: pilus assembly protein [Anaerolineales bacterium]|nr:pilus assembly protein [Anaerolineales bacterium]